MSSATTNKPPGALSVFLGTLAAFASFAVITAVLQATAGGRPADPTSAERLQKKEDVAKEQHALLEKYGLDSNPAPVFAKSLEQLKNRKVAPTTQVVPGSPTALKAAAAPAPAAPATAPAAPAPAPAAAPAPAPGPAATPAPAPAAPATPAPAAPAPTPAPAPAPQ